MSILRNQLSSTTNKSKTLLQNIVDKVTTSTSKILLDKILDRYTYKFILANGESVRKLISYLREINPKIEKKLINGMIPNDSLIVTLVEENTIVATICGSPFMNASDRYIVNRMYKSDDNPVTVYVAGKHSKKLFNRLKKITDVSNKGLVVYNISTNPSSREPDKDSFQSIITDLNERNIDTLFYKDDTKEDIIAHIDSFFKNQEIYRKRNIAFKTGILLYGEPGTGKSSLANALASKYGLNMVLVNINTFDKLDVQTLTSCFNADDNTYICLLEDIDTLYNINREDENADKDDKKVINKLLQFLDSNSSPDNVIFIATTNYKEKLDDALLREGRFGKKFYIGPITETEAVKMCKSFECTPEMIDHILSQIEDKTHINQSKLQGLILDEFKNSELKEDINNEQTEA